MEQHKRQAREYGMWGRVLGAQAEGQILHLHADDVEYFGLAGTD